jgi:hypothetical protein
MLPFRSLDLDKELSQKLWLPKSLNLIASKKNFHQIFFALILEQSNIYLCTYHT